MSETEYGKEKKVAGFEPTEPESIPSSDVEAAEGSINPLKRNLQGRHMQMIAIGKFGNISSRPRGGLLTV
jgi:amino acid transporter